MSRKFTAGVLFAVAVAALAASTVSAEQPDGILCKHPKGKVFQIWIPKDGTMGDAVQACLALDGHPVGVFVGKGVGK